MSLISQMQNILGADTQSARAAEIQKAAMQQAQVPWSGVQGTSTGATNFPGAHASKPGITIDPVDNGYIVHVRGSDPGVRTVTYVATDIDELQKVIALALVNQKIAEVR